MADENVRYYYHQAVGNDPMRRQVTANTVLWDSNDGTPFVLPPGRNPAHYINKGYRTYPPVGFVANKDLHLQQPIEPSHGDPWTPKHEKSDLQRGLEVILAKQAEEEKKKTALADAVVANQEKLAAALESLAGIKLQDETPKNKPGRPRKVRDEEPETAEA